MEYLHLQKGLRLRGNLPKIGIRIIVDGRRDGIREMLEEPILIQAKKVKLLLENNLFYPSGDKVQVILSETSIGGVSEAAKVQAQFNKEGVGAILDITRDWAYPSEVIDLDPVIPKAIWGFNGSERPGSVYLACATATSEQKGLPVFKIFGRDVQDADDYSIPNDVAEQILLFCKAALAINIMRNKSYLSIGSVSMGIGGSILIPDLFQTYFGMRNEFVDMTEIIRRIDKEIYDVNEFHEAQKWVQENCIEYEDTNPSMIQESKEKKASNWEIVIKMYLIARDLMIGNEKLSDIGYKEESEGHNAILAGFQGQRSWTDHFPNGDFMEAMLNSSFDWNGIRQPYLMATENDSLNGLSMLMGHLLTGTSQIFADVRTYWSPYAIMRVTNMSSLPEEILNGFIYLSNSGAAALDGTGESSKDNKSAILPHWEMTTNDVKKCINATSWGPAKLSAFRGGGFSSNYTTKGDMPMTIVKLNFIKNQGPVLQLAEGFSIDLPTDIRDIIVSRTDETWPKTFFVPKLTGTGVFKDVYSVMNKWASNHCSISYGHIGHELITLASMLRIPVMMHNVEEERIFRPSIWSTMGTESLESADYRACNLLGSLYK
ncbi:MAG: L-fucose isomerase [Firmicutes bacterium HGW-Firmicutes-3]|jgi:L-fucose isomerase|nr:MAG: L-fucose isomerase [Firmicutes bacterium HGW-Firmicutes-3]